MWLGLQTVSSLERCLIYSVSFIKRFHCTYQRHAYKDTTTPLPFAWRDNVIHSCNQTQNNNSSAATKGLHTPTTLNHTPLHRRAVYKSTSELRTPLYTGQPAGSQWCPLKRGSTEQTNKISSLHSTPTKVLCEYQQLTLERSVLCG